MRLLPYIIILISIIVAVLLMQHWIMPWYNEILFALETVAKPS